MGQVRQVGPDDLHGDRGRRVGTETAALYHDADGYLRVVGWGERGEDRVVQARVVDPVLRRAGLRGDHDPGGGESGGDARGAERRLGNVDHHALNLGGDAWGDRLVQHGGVGVLQLGEVRRGDLLHQVRLHQRAVIRDRGGEHGLLQRGDRVVELPDGGVRGEVWVGDRREDRKSVV